MKRKEFTEVNAYSLKEIKENSYNINNMLLKQLKFPQFFYKQDVVNTLDIKMLILDEYEKYEKLTIKYFEKFVNNWGKRKDSPKIKKFLEDYIENEINGFRLIQNTTIDGYSIYTFQTYMPGLNSPRQKLYTGQEGPLIIQSESKEIFVSKKKL